ncbi:hypothetical protein Aduo_015262 [Ancylostoma duodenale]
MNCEISLRGSVLTSEEPGAFSYVTLVVSQVTCFFRFVILLTSNSRRFCTSGESSRSPNALWRREIRDAVNGAGDSEGRGVRTFVLTKRLSDEEEANEGRIGENS